MLTGGIFTSKLTFLYSAYARRESRICFHRNSFAQNGTQFVQFPYFACRFSPRLRLIAELSDGAVINFDEQLFCPSLASAVGGGRAKRSYPRVGFNRAIFPDTAQNSLSIRQY